MMSAVSEDPIEFTLDDPPTFPNRSSTGRAIKGPVIRAFAEQAEAEKRAHHALDDLVILLRKHQFDVPEYVKEITKRETGRTHISRLMEQAGYAVNDVASEKIR